MYIINATYLGPLTYFIYLRYGRPPAIKPHLNEATIQASVNDPVGTQKTDTCHPGHENSVESSCSGDEKPTESCHMAKQESDEEKTCHSNAPASSGHACHSHGVQRPMWATITVGVFHCGAGCVLGDIVGEWIAWGAGVTLNGRMIWASLLIDYAFALLFGIFFQYFSIAPMSGKWGPVTVWRAAKADILSLTSFQVGLFAWMIASQVGIFNYNLDTNTWLYWWMMQVGMILGTATAYPVNYFLLKWNIKEPCC